jgi:hypothetical protein
MTVTARGWLILAVLVAAAAFAWGAVGWTVAGPAPAVRHGVPVECRSTSTTLCPRP